MWSLTINVGKVYEAVDDLNRKVAIKRVEVCCHLVLWFNHLIALQKSDNFISREVDILKSVSEFCITLCLSCRFYDIQL